MPIDLSLVVAFAITIACTFLLKPLAVRLGLVDEPGGRKIHQGNVPLIGGIAMFIGLNFALLTLNVSLSEYRSFIACATLLTITGLLDDFHELAPRSRLFVQILVGLLIAIWGNNKLVHLGNLVGLGQVSLGFFALPVTVIATVGVINAINMMDGLDGFAGSITLVEFFYLALLATRAHLQIDAIVLYLIITVLIAFLCFNFPWRQHASIFMGDAGSMTLGFFLVWFSIRLSQAPNMAARPVTFLWIMAVPLWDIGSVVWHRLTRGFSPFRADRRHLHHHLLRRKYSPLQATLLGSALSAASGFVGMLGERLHIREPAMFIGFIIAFVIYLLIQQGGWRRFKKISAEKM